MRSSVDFSGRPFHFIGIGGIGMSALAYILAKRKLPISGSDIKSTHITERLQGMGARIFWHQDASNFELFQANIASEDLGIGENSLKSLSSGSIKGEEASALTKPLGRIDNSRVNGNANPNTKDKFGKLPQVICSTAINPTNSEYKAAIELGCPIFHRSDLLAALINDYQSIAVAGTHGKTTTSSMVAFMLLKAGLEPTIVVGGEVNAWEGNARLGKGPYLVAEADESDGSLVKLSAYIGVVTNIELDHPDRYQSLDEVVEIFKAFESNCQTLVGCIDCQTVRDCLRPTVSYSLNLESGADYAVDCVEYGSDGVKARVWERGKALGLLQMQLLGQHNLSNALAAVVVGRLLNLEFSAIADAIASFEGARRRFECRGEHNNILFVDDYAHHPSEIRATLAGARQRKNNRESTSKLVFLPPKKFESSNSLPELGQQRRSPIERVVAIFQPHRYSRTHTFLSEFAQSFGDADIVLITDIYSAGERNLWQINGQQVADSIALYHQRVYYESSLEGVKNRLSEILRSGDLALFLGAGNLNQVIPEVMAFYQQAEERVVSMAERSISAELS